MATPTMIPESTEEDASPRYLQRIDLRTALIVAAVFNTVIGVALALVGFLVIGVAAQRGFLEQVNSAASDLSTGHPLHLSAVRLCMVWLLVVVVWTVAMTIVAGLATVIFNSVLRLFGGVRLDLTATRPPMPDVGAHAARARQWVTTTARKARARVPTPVLRLDSAGSVFRGLLETGPMTPGRAPSRPSAPAAAARRAVESQASQLEDEESG